MCKRSCAVDQLTRERRWLVSSRVSTLGWSSPRSRLDASQDQRQAARQCDSARLPCAAPTAVCSLPDFRAVPPTVKPLPRLPFPVRRCWPRPGCYVARILCPLPQPGLRSGSVILRFNGAAVLRLVASSATRLPRKAQVSAAQHAWRYSGICAAPLMGQLFDHK